MGLLPLEFTDGLTDSPYFRETLQAHERELDRTNVAIKHLIKDIKDLILAARNLSRAQRTLSDTLNNFNFECIGTSQTDDEMVIANSFKDFARLLSTIEDERDRLLEKADEAFLEPIERFRREQIGSAKEAKKKFDKETAKHCQNLEKYLNTSIKKGENQLQEADANYSIEQWHFFKAMSEYVLKLQEVNERKKFEFVETVLSFMLGWLTFYHQGHEIATDFYSVKMELQMRLQRTRNNFNMTQEETKCLRAKMLNNSEKLKQKFQDHGSFNKMYTRQGYLFLMEKKAFSTSWTKHFCQYDKSTHRLTMIQYTQTTGKIASTEEIVVKECIRRNTDLIDRRFCFDVVTESGHGVNGPNGSVANSGFVSNGSHDNVYTFQALSEEDYKLWFEALDGKERKDSNTKPDKKMSFKAGGGGDGGRMPPGLHEAQQDTYELDEEGYYFLRKCIKTIEARGLEQKGIYRMVGVASKVRHLMELFNEKRLQTIAKRKNSTDASCSVTSSESDDSDLFELNLDSEEFEMKTITSALKSYLRNLSEPIMTFQLHSAFISASKLENRAMRMERIHLLVHKLPPLNFKVLKSLIEHLQKVSKLHDKNLMTASNLGVCFGPTLLRTAEESVAAILDIKFVNVIAELLIENYEKIFLTKPPTTDDSASNLNAKGPSHAVDSTIQQRPLPHVPNSIAYVSQFSPPPGQMHSPTGKTANSLFFAPQYRYGQLQQQHPATAARSVSSGQSKAVDGYGRQLVSTGNAVRRSSSQDQLYSVIPAALQQQQRSRALYGSPNANVPLTHLQHAQSRHLGYSTFPHLPASATANRKPLHLSSSSPSPSPSSTISSTPASLHAQSAHIYQAPMLLKNATVTSTSPSAIYGQLRPPMQLLQPSMSYQNLHYNSEIAAATSEMALGLAANATYSRPMTSIGLLPLHSPLAATGNRVDSQFESSKAMAVSVSPPSQLAPQSLLDLNAAGGGSGLQPRQFNLSSTSSASLPSTPEHSQQPSQFPYRAPNVLVPSAGVKQSLTPPPSAIDGAYDVSHQHRSADAYGPMYSPLPSGQAALYGTIGHQGQRPLTTMAGQQAPSPGRLPSTKVRTRYVCIGGSEQELSFQPNMIITNVRNSREPGWIEGNLNGKTGLIPLNYVEFID